MNYLTLDTNALLFFCLTIYVIAAIFLLPNQINVKLDHADAASQKALQFAFRFVMRITLVFPMMFLLKNSL